jgi:hypothetical protein
MPMIRVKAVPGHVAHTKPKGGELITHDDAGQLVRETPWIVRLRDVHGAIVPVKTKKAPADKAETDTAN